MLSEKLREQMQQSVCFLILNVIYLVFWYCSVRILVNQNLSM